MKQDTQTLTLVEFSARDFDTAKRIAEALGYSQYPYTSTSALWGLFCLPENPERAKPGEPLHGATIIKTRELGFLVVQNLEELGIDEKGRIISDRPLRGRR